MPRRIVKIWQWRPIFTRPIDLQMDDNRGFLETMIGDGRPLLIVTALILPVSGAFAIFQAATGQFLPHDADYLGMTAHDLCTLHGCRILHFMIHDRISFGGVLLGIGVMYLWLCLFPLRAHESWAWWALAISGGAGFLSFLAYLGYGYLDTWHGAATLVLLPIFAAGPVPRASAAPRAGRASGARPRLGPGDRPRAAAHVDVRDHRGRAHDHDGRHDVGGRARRQCAAHLIPLIAHDRAGFGGALVSCGLAMFLCVLCGRPTRTLWQALTIAGLAGFGTTLGIHPAIGYTSVSHLGPAVFGCGVFAAGLALTATRRDGRVSP